MPSEEESGNFIWLSLKISYKSMNLFELPESDQFIVFIPIPWYYL